MSEICPRCKKPVYFAEKIRVFGTSWHQLCLKCADCNKLLDSGNAQEHEGEAYCKSCYGKFFGPKGYGFSGGASGLSMDTGKYGEVTRDNVSHLAKAQVPPSGGESKWGGADGCPRCKKPVYFAEECRAMGAKYHKMCLACVKCNKLLDSTTCNDHDGEIFCKNCYSKSFGPKGYGFAGGASGLSMDTGKRHDVTTENVSHLAQAQAAPALNNGKGGKFGGSDSCPRCGKAVYFAEEIRALNKKFHKLCLRCGYTTPCALSEIYPSLAADERYIILDRAHRVVKLAKNLYDVFIPPQSDTGNCNKMLDSTTCTDHGDDIYCKACYGKLYGPKGYGFAGGASGLSMDTGNPNEVTRENVSAYSKAQAAPSLMENGNSSKLGGAEMCGRCGKAVYFAEKVIGGGNTYHKSCFKCTSCGKNLDSTTLTQAEGEIFCKACYGKHFGPKGFGFGQALQHTN